MSASAVSQRQSVSPTPRKPRLLEKRPQLSRHHEFIIAPPNANIHTHQLSLLINEINDFVSSGRVERTRKIFIKTFRSTQRLLRRTPEETTWSSSEDVQSKEEHSRYAYLSRTYKGTFPSTHSRRVLLLDEDFQTLGGYDPISMEMLTRWCRVTYCSCLICRGTERLKGLLKRLEILSSREIFKLFPDAPKLERSRSSDVHGVSAPTTSRWGKTKSPSYPMLRKTSFSTITFTT